MVESLRVDTTVLSAAGTSLDAVADEFADQVAGFAMGWDEIRIGMVTDITFLGEACTRIGTTLEALDVELAARGTAP